MAGSYHREDPFNRLGNARGLAVVGIGVQRGWECIPALLPPRKVVRDAVIRVASSNRRARCTVIKSIVYFDEYLFIY